ncbi:hypothetical protein [Mucilaginibacter polytrichastri]|uniref:hypothetical protein n=1 Tax=Mucilaginibacter polytrichastri TaxID=1302689 RepID=UPI001113A759|nr:hypothetical protein [Mucilaginibacter polytrichastri]
MKNNINDSFKATIASDEALSLVKEYSEVALDSILKGGVLKDIPLVGTVVGLFKIGNSLKEQHTIKKILVFINQSAEIPKEDREAFLNKLSDNDEYKESIAEKVLLLIERLDETKKAEIIGNLFRLMVMGIIGKDYFLRLSGIVERALLYDLLALHYRYSYFGKDWDGDQPYNINSANESALAAFGLMKLKLGTEPSKMARASGLMNSGLTDPTLGYEVSSLGQELANLMMYDLEDKDFQDHIAELKPHQETNGQPLF